MCYDPTLIVIYQYAKSKKKITKYFAHFPYEKIDDFIAKHKGHYEMIKWKEKVGDDYVECKDFCLCLDVVQVPCGNCIGCCLAKSKNRSTRLKLENQYQPIGYFITLTYNDEFLPKNYQLVKDHLKKFIKDVKNYFYHRYNCSPRYFAVGEYGGKSGRPHYHLILWADLTDNFQYNLKPVGKSELGNLLYSSEFISRFWLYGFNSVAEVDNGSIDYICRYSLKKQNRSRDEKKELIALGIQPEFLLCSQGLGDRYYLDNFDKIVDNHGSIYLNGEILTTERRFKKISDKLQRSSLVDSIVESNSNLFLAKTSQLFSNSGDNSVNKYLRKCEKNVKKRIELLKRGN